MGETERESSWTEARNLQHLIDVLPDSIAIVASDGTLKYINEAWRDFVAETVGNSGSYRVGSNYKLVLQKVLTAGSHVPDRIAQELSRILFEGGEFKTEFDCRSSVGRRWYALTVRRLEIDGEPQIMALHREVTADKQHQIEARSAAQESRNLSEIISQMPDAVVGLDLKGRITGWNEAAHRLYGYSADEVMGRPVDVLFPPDWDGNVATYITDLISQEQSRFEVVRQTRSGQRRTIEITAALVRSTSGEIVGVSNVNRDVTDKRRSEQRLRDVLDNLFVFVGVLEVDGTLIEANRPPLEAAGLKATEVIGRKFWDCYWWNHSPASIRKLQGACEKVRAGNLVRYDAEIRIAGGKKIWIDFQLAPLLNDQGEVENLIPSGIDITDRRAALEALENSHDTFSNLVQRSPFGIYTIDHQFRLAHVSDGAQKVFSNVRPLIGRDFAEVLHILWPEDFATEAIERFRHTLATGEPYRSQRMVERRYDIDEVESYDWKIERIQMPDGRPGVVCHFYDLSERQKHEEHVQYLMREVNHRAKNLLTVVISIARQTARDCSPQEFVKRFSPRLLGLAASQDLIVQANWSGVTVEDLVRSQLNFIEQETRHNRIEISGPDLALTPAAAQGIGMALHELATNALKYGALSVPDGQISVRWSVDTAADTFCIGWCEHDGPPVQAPEMSGFGQTVIETMAAISVDGAVDLTYRPQGVAWTLRASMTKIGNPLPLPDVTEGAATDV